MKSIGVVMYLLYTAFVFYFGGYSAEVVAEYPKLHQFFTDYWALKLIALPGLLFIFPPFCFITLPLIYELMKLDFPKAFDRLEHMLEPVCQAFGRLKPMIETVCQWIGLVLVYALAGVIIAGLVGAIIYTFAGIVAGMSMTTFLLLMILLSINGKK